MKKISTVINLLKEKRIRIFVINYEPLKDRKEYLRKKLLEIGLSGFVSWFIQKPGQYTQKEFDEIYSVDKKKWKKDIYLVEGPKDFKQLNVGELNLILNHYKIYEKMVKEKTPISLILEDDVILEEDFLERLERCIKKLPEKFDIAYTDAGMHLRLNKKIHNLKYSEHKGRKTRTTASYFISLEGAKKFLKNKKVTFPLDLEMRVKEIKNNLNVYWLGGYLTYQGSVYGNYYKTVLQDERQKPNRIKRIIFEVEKKRFNKDIFSKIEVFLLDFLILPLLRTFKDILTSCKNEKQF